MAQVSIDMRWDLLLSFPLHFGGKGLKLHGRDCCVVQIPGRKLDTVNINFISYIIQIFPLGVLSILQYPDLSKIGRKNINSLKTNIKDNLCPDAFACGHPTFRPETPPPVRTPRSFLARTGAPTRPREIIDKEP